MGYVKVNSNIEVDKKYEVRQRVQGHRCDF